MYFDRLVCATQKIDGSNLSMHIKYDDGKWSIVKINGRNTIVWNNEMEKDILNISYGSPEKLEKLPLVMFDYCIRLAKILTNDLKTPINELYVYGEAYRLKGQPLVSWHPFGYKIPEKEIIDSSSSNYKNSIKFLNSQTHKLLISAQEPKIPTVLTIEDFIKLLENCTEHIICVPICLFVGDLRTCINTLFEQMKTNNELFEGCFIIFEDYNEGCKWKTGLFEEQIKITPISESLFKLEENINVYAKLEYIFNTRPDYSERKNMLLSNQKKEKTELLVKTIKQLESDLLIACKHEITKFISINEISLIPKVERKKLVEKLIELSIQEVLEKYKESQYEISWTHEQINKSAYKIINPFIMKIDYLKS